MMSQEALVAKSQELHKFVDELIAVVFQAAQDGTPVHQVEGNVFTKLLILGLKLIELLVQCLGDGDVGEEYQREDGRTLKRSKEPKERSYVSIFGPLSIVRYVYAQREGQKVEFAPIDARLALPESKFSYLLQDWDQDSAMEQPFKKVGKTIERILGLEQHVDSLERMNRKMAEDTEAFHDAQEKPPADEEGEIFVQTGDGKGVPIQRKPGSAPIQDHRHQPGPKPDRKKMATVGAVYSVDRFVRTPEDIVEALFRDSKQENPQTGEPRPRPCHKRMRAVLNHTNSDGVQIEGRAVVFGWMAEELEQRHTGSDKPIVCIMDGEDKLWEMRDVFQGEKSMVDILDLLHVTPRLWSAAALFYPADSDEAEKFVRDRVLRILRGEVGAVITGLRRMATLRELSRKDRSKLETICGYFANNLDRMRYDEYLAAGYPIASGVIEGACRHIIKDRLERTGMTWVVEGAQAMLNLRCIYVADQWDDYIKFRIERETERLYPYRDKLDRIPWDAAA